MALSRTEYVCLQGEDLSFVTHASDTASGRATELTLSISVVNYTDTFPDFEKPLHFHVPCCQTFC